MQQLPPPLRLAAVALVSGAVICGCGTDATDAAGPGEIEISLVSPHGEEGAAALELRGPGLGDFTVGGGYVFSHHSGDMARVVVIQDPPGPIRFRVTLADVAQLPMVEVIRVADGSNRPRPALAGYRVDLEVRP